ncbi:hypothetical protein BDB00DRAFT_860571 [Zychaea mexicana]|uniref:uncharacterized protein n=1 Tax=Zychaea mexicana TaxID=64656 RepID=UPI0022FF2143|nr:uncharacterized protein BDB00DRAFT_860571 [Zychaea mexicana]KAI9474320.1 hypothetical protein BDB00DRAFT_860571 [Zychaea mexicana]
MWVWQVLFFFFVSAVFSFVSVLRGSVGVLLLLLLILLFFRPGVPVVRCCCCVLCVLFFFFGVFQLFFLSFRCFVVLSVLFSSSSS